MKSKPIDIRRRLSTSKDDLRDLSYLIAISPDMRLLWFHVMVIAINYWGATLLFCISNLRTAPAYH